MSRLFFALWPDELTRRFIVELSDQLPPDGRRIPAANLHITLVFLGIILEEQQDLLINAASKIHCEAFTLSLDQFGWWQRPQIIQAAPTQIPDELRQLVEELEQLAIKHGVNIERRPYNPHVTLMRKIRTAPILPEPEPVIWPVDDFCLVRSDTLPEGAHYEVIWRRYQ